jgi:hypothetical protein
MREFPDTPTPGRVYRFAVDFCQPHVDFHPAGKITATTLVTASFAAAARNSSISQSKSGKAIVAGFNLPNRVELKDARPGKVYQIAVFGISRAGQEPRAPATASGRVRSWSFRRQRR